MHQRSSCPWPKGCHRSHGYAVAHSWRRPTWHCSARRHWNAAVARRCIARCHGNTSLHCRRRRHRLHHLELCMSTNWSHGYRCAPHHRRCWNRLHDAFDNRRRGNTTYWCLRHSARGRLRHWLQALGQCRHPLTALPGRDVASKCGHQQHRPITTRCSPFRTSPLRDQF